MSLVTGRRSEKAPRGVASMAADELSHATTAAARQQ
jgi:hypothetical protein